MERALKEGKRYDEALTQLAESEVTPALLAEGAEDEEEKGSAQAGARSKQPCRASRILIVAKGRPAHEGLRGDFPLCASVHFRSSHAISDRTTLTMIMVVIGMKNLKPGLSTTMSPGRRPIGSFEIQGQAAPMATIIRPRTIRTRCIM